MAQVTIKGAIYFDPSRHAGVALGKFRFFSGVSDAFCDYIKVCDHTLTFDDGGFDPRPIQIQALEAKRKELQAQFAAAVTEIQRQINELQAIEMEAA